MINEFPFVPIGKTGLPFQNFRLSTEFSSGTNQKNVYHFHPNRNFREFVVNGKQPVSIIDLLLGGKSQQRRVSSHFLCKRYKKRNQCWRPDRYRHFLQWRHQANYAWSASGKKNCTFSCVIFRSFEDYAGSRDSWKGFLTFFVVGACLPFLSPSACFEPFTPAIFCCV